MHNTREDQIRVNIWNSDIEVVPLTPKTILVNIFDAEVSMKYLRKKSEKIDKKESDYGEATEPRMNSNKTEDSKEEVDCVKGFSSDFRADNNELEK